MYASLELALTTFFKFVHGNQDGIVDKATKAESIGGFKPGCNVTENNRQANQG